MCNATIVNPVYFGKYLEYDRSRKNISVRKKILKNKALYLGLFIAVLTLAGCKKTVPVRDYNNMPFPQYSVGKNTAKSLEVAIVRAAVSLGWIPKIVQEGEIVATLNIRSHQLVVTIFYDAKEYSIKYKDSTNLMYDGKKIHRQYDNWTRNLISKINAFSIPE